jgi:hypothetical protein
MQVTKISFITVLAAASRLMASPLAETPADSGTNTMLQALVRREEGPGLLPADRAFVTFGTNQFAFIVPAGFKMEPWNDGRVGLVTTDFSCQIIFRVVGPLPTDGKELDPDVYGRLVLADHPGASLIRTFSAIADSRRGPAYELESDGPAGILRREQIAFIPSRSLVLEFRLVANREKFDKARQQLSTMMLTFRGSDEKGELHVSPMSDKL